MTSPIEVPIPNPKKLAIVLKIPIFNIFVKHHYYQVPWKFICTMWKIRREGRKLSCSRNQSGKTFQIQINKCSLSASCCGSVISGEKGNGKDKKLNIYLNVMLWYICNKEGHWNKWPIKTLFNSHLIHTTLDKETCNRVRVSVRSILSDFFCKYQSFQHPRC